MTHIDLVVTDLDGTLWDHNEVVHDRTVAALSELAHSEVPLLVATGRRTSGALRGLVRYGLDLPLVALDGAFGLDVTDGRPGRRWHRHAFEPAAAQGVLAAFDAVGLSPVAFVDRPGVEVVCGPVTSTSERHLSYIAPALECVDLHHVVGAEPIFGFAVADGSPTAIAAAVEAIGDRAVAYVTIGGFYPGHTITVRPVGTSKWAGVEAFCADRGLDPARVLALGDGPNDVELLRGAAVSCGISGGCDEALALADHVLGGPGDGGWADVVGLVAAGLDPQRFPGGPRVP